MYWIVTRWWERLDPNQRPIDYESDSVPGPDPQHWGHAAIARSSRNHLCMDLATDAADPRSTDT